MVVVVIYKLVSFSAGFLGFDSFVSFSNLTNRTEGEERKTERGREERRGRWMEGRIFGF